MNCPVCLTPLIISEYQGIELDHCLECQGLWFDGQELSFLAASLGAAADFPDIAAIPIAESEETIRHCPRCQAPMEKFHMGEQPCVLLDRCPQEDGLWFDAGELGKVLTQYSSATAQPIMAFLNETLGSRTQS